MLNSISDYCSHVCFYGQHEKCKLTGCECKCHSITEIPGIIFTGPIKQDWTGFDMRDRKAREETKDIEDKFRKLTELKTLSETNPGQSCIIDNISDNEITLTKDEALGLWSNLKNVWLNRDDTYEATKNAMEKIYQRFIGSNFRS